MDSRQPDSGRRIPPRASLGLVSGEEPPAGSRTRRAEYPTLPPRLEEGECLGRWRIGQEIAWGGHSTVYRARHVDDGRAAAIKVLAPQLAVCEPAVRRFRAEVRFAGRVRHRAIVPVLDEGTDRGHAWYATGLERGATLAEAVPDALLPVERGFYVTWAERFVGLADAVAELHRVGLVHRDIKPANILVAGDGSLLLSDFGSALDGLRRDRELEQSPGGTILYMAPEQLQPGVDPTDPAGDIYALGATLYEVLTGAPPFACTDEHELARTKLKRRPEPPRARNAAIPLPLDRTVRRAMDVPALLRYRSAGELARALDRFARRRRSPSGRR